MCRIAETRPKPDLTAKFLLETGDVDTNPYPLRPASEVR
jgi:hypothetical protein